MADPREFNSPPVLSAVQIEEFVYRVVNRRAPASKGRYASGALEESEVRLVPPFNELLRLPPGSQQIEIHYAAPAFTAPENIRFQTSLATDGRWSDGQEGRVARYHELLPGHYVFRVRNGDSDGVWNEESTSLAFVIAPFYWQTVWFRVAAGLSLVGLGAGLTFWITREHRQRREAEKARRGAEKAAREVSGKLITAQEDERKRIARDLHDDLNQRLALLSVEMELLGQVPAGNPALSHQRIEGIAKRVKDLSSEVHKLSYRLHPAKLDQLGLIAAARSFCREFSQQAGLPVEFIHDQVPTELSSDVALCFYRIIQESLQNILKHSGAEGARVELGVVDAYLRLIVSDNGRGFDLDHALRQGGLGLVGMRERARLAHGKITFHSAPGRGTRIELAVPLSKDQLTPA